MSLLSMMTGHSMNESSGSIPTDHTPSSSVPPSPSLGLQVSESFAEPHHSDDQRSTSSSVDSRRVRNRFPLEGHVSVQPSEGGIVVLNGCQPPEWEDLPNAAALHEFQRDVVFSGEQIQVLVYLRPLDPSFPKEKSLPSPPPPPLPRNGSEPAPPPPLARTHSNTVDLGLGVLQPSASLKTKPPALDVAQGATQGVRREGHGRRSQLLFESAQRSHFVVQMKDPQATSSAPKSRSSVFGGSRSKPAGSRWEGGGLLDSHWSEAHGCTPLLMEDGVFDPLTGGGLARRVAAVCAMDNGDVAVLLEVSLATALLTEQGLLEVLQFERLEPHTDSDSFSDPSSPHPPRPSAPANPVRSLGQWLLPLDRPFPADFSPSPASSSFSTPTPSFSFATLSSVSLPMPRFPTSPLFSSALPPPTPRPGFEDGGEEESRFVGSEGLMSFRGSGLEPQRFGVQCGLKGTYVPGRRWARPLSLLQPLKMESYCTPNLICLMVQNCLPPTPAYRHLAVYIDAISLECDRGLGQGEGPLPVHLASVQAGEGGGDLMPGLAVRAGEQHSFVLHPYMPSLGGGAAPTAPPAAPPPPKGIPDSGSLKWLLPAKQEEAAEPPPPHWAEQWEYSVVISCRCSHSESSLHYRHKLTWRPSPPRELLLSVSLEGAPPSSTGTHFIPQTVVVRASNLTDHEMALTLLAPTSLAATALSRISFPGTPTHRPIHHSASAGEAELGGVGVPSALKLGNPTPPPAPPARKSPPHSRRGSGGSAEEMMGGGRQEGGGGGGETGAPGGGGGGAEKKTFLRSSTTRPSRDHATRTPSLSLSRMNSLSGHPLHRMDSLLGISTGDTPRPQPSSLSEKRSSGGEGGPDLTSQRSHLWLQSVVPIGRVPARGTVEVRCELLPLSEGIITLDTLHVATKRRDVLYIPEKPLQVFSAGVGSVGENSKGNTASGAATAYADFGVRLLNK